MQDATSDTKQEEAQTEIIENSKTLGVEAETSSLVEIQAFSETEGNPITFLIESKMFDEIMIRSRSKVLITNLEIIESPPSGNESRDLAAFSQESISEDQ